MQWIFNGTFDTITTIIYFSIHSAAMRVVLIMFLLRVYAVQSISSHIRLNSSVREMSDNLNI